MTERLALGVLWGKSKAGPEGDARVNLLLQHLLDAAAVGELIWDRFLARGVRERIDRSCDERGRQMVALLCGLHDVGKATPAFQGKVPLLADRVRAAGLGWDVLTARDRAWHHTLAGAVIVRRVLADAGWDRRARSWLWPLIAGHHGVIPGTNELRVVPADAQGRGSAWLAAQDALVWAVAAALDVDLAWVPPGVPRRAEQLALSGVIIMADWIASGSHFPGVDDIARVSMAGARRAIVARITESRPGSTHPLSRPDRRLCTVKVLESRVSLFAQMISLCAQQPSQAISQRCKHVTPQRALPLTGPPAGRSPKAGVKRMSATPLKPPLSALSRREPGPPKAGHAAAKTA